MNRPICALSIVLHHHASEQDVIQKVISDFTEKSAKMAAEALRAMVQMKQSKWNVWVVEREGVLNLVTRTIAKSFTEAEAYVDSHPESTEYTLLNAKVVVE